MRTPDQLVEQFRAGGFVEVLSVPGAVSLKHVQAIGHIPTEAGHMAYVFTVQAHGLLLEPFTTAAAAQAFVERCAAACTRKELLR